MHIAEGVLSWPVLVAGAVGTAAGVGLGLRKTDEQQLPRVAVLASAFFVASLIHVPVGPSSAHLILNGLIGVILGWAAFPAILVALFLQSILFGFGGPTVLGANVLVMAVPAIACHYLFTWAMGCATRPTTMFALGFVTGVMGILIATALLAVMLYSTGAEFQGVVKLVLLAHIPVMGVEGLVTGWAVVLLHRVRPQLLRAALAPT